MEMVSRLRPLARRRFSTLRPVGVAIRARNPCVRFRLRLLGWYVLFIGKGSLNHAPGTKSILAPGRVVVTTWRAGELLQLGSEPTGHQVDDRLRRFLVLVQDVVHL